MLLPERGHLVRIGRKAEKVFVRETRNRSEALYYKCLFLSFVLFVVRILDSRRSFGLSADVGKLPALPVGA